MKAVGFTGTRRGMTDGQKVTLARLFGIMMHDLYNYQFHHGDCIGADEEAHNLFVKQFTFRKWAKKWIFIHPPTNGALRAHCSCVLENLHRPKPYLARNQVIVDSTELLLACPGEEKAVQGSGTWHTIDYALQQTKPVIIIYPDGYIVRHNINLSVSMKYLANDRP
jgi:hypothetical protein